VFPDCINDLPGDVSPQQVTEFVPSASMGCSISSLPYLAVAMAEHPNSGFDLKDDWRRAAIFYGMVAGPNNGMIRNIPFSNDPLIRHKLEAAHLRALADVLKKLCGLLLAAGAQALYPSIEGLSPLCGEADLVAIPEELPRSSTNLMTIHLFSSCPMGEERNLCAVDSFGNVQDRPNLIVNDASILCTAPGVNPQGTIMSLARRN